MTIADKLITPFTLPESETSRIEARDKAREAADPGDWLSQILDHHMDIEDAFATARRVNDAASRDAALKQLIVVITAHAIAEESVIYPALAAAGEQAFARSGYDEQAMIKVELAFLERLDPMSRGFMERLKQIESALMHHIHAEEGRWFLGLKETASADDQAMLTRRYAEEYGRYVGGKTPSAFAMARQTGPADAAVPWR